MLIHWHAYSVRLTLRPANGDAAARHPYQKKRREEILRAVFVLSGELNVPAFDLELRQ
jgi:hypothetical protein